MKMYCIYCEETIKDFNGIRGKMTSQSGHAFLNAFLDSQIRFPYISAQYAASVMQPKISLIAKTIKELEDIKEYYKAQCGVHLVTDAGITVFNKPTITCLGIGPIMSTDVQPNISSLPLFK
jgi:peptidyl-tRNA hydrolase